MISRSRCLATALVLAHLAAACAAGGSGDEGLAPVEHPACVTGTDIHRSLAVTEPLILAYFPFVDVMDRIRMTGAPGTTQTNAQLFQQWMRAFGGCSDPAIDPNGYGLVCPRAHESKLASIDPFTAGATVAFEPVGLFNRFDLAPSTAPPSGEAGGTCGEYRIVYAMRSINPAITGRAFISFEAALPNPSPGKAVEGCVEVAKFWQALSDDPDPRSRALKLRAFYFDDNTVPGFPAAIKAQHFGLVIGEGFAFGPGQIRTNFFVGADEWQLREWKLRTAGPPVVSPKLAFEHVTAKANPAEELFAGTHPLAASFRASFDATIASLASGSAIAIALSTGDAFNEFESVSSSDRVEYRRAGNAAMRALIANRLTALGSPLSVDNLLDRATSQTCAGCHQRSNGASLGDGLVWPASGSFVHIDERGLLSPALTGVFLPHRRAVLEDFINKVDCFSLPVLPAQGRTVGGGAIGAPN